MANDPTSFLRRLRAVDQRITNNKERRACGGKGLGAIVTSGPNPEVRGLLETCGQNACPQCADRDRPRKRRGVEARTTHWMGHGMAAVGVRFAPPHRACNDFHEVRDWLDQALRTLFAGRDGQAFRRELGIGPIDKSWETTYSIERGPHPHVHAVLYLLCASDDVDYLALESRLKERWSVVLGKTEAPIWDGNRDAVAKHGVWVQPIKSPEATAAYLTKGTMHRDKSGRLRATGMFVLLEALADHEDALGAPCYCEDCKRNAAVWRKFADPADSPLPPGTPKSHAKAYASRNRFSPARKFDEACANAGIPTMLLAQPALHIEARCRIRYDAWAAIQECMAEQQVVEAALVGGVTDVAAEVARCYVKMGMPAEVARRRAAQQVTDPPEWTRRVRLAPSQSPHGRPAG
ncbi:hypothetical protein [Nocardioides xinjiangensis]|uniref:hypothetical protein n=1 Tax=Nocardioides xinjiangensis TaxID=2817376 RepID=UPI001B30B1B0|nr:hypothetical protein [Nocardioides sp. SYSU D00514]